MSEKIRKKRICLQLTSEDSVKSFTKPIKIKRSRFQFRCGNLIFLVNDGVAGRAKTSSGSLSESSIVSIHNIGLGTEWTVIVCTLN